jgi:hypothetical protein
MVILTPFRGLRVGVFALAVIDAAITIQVCSFIHYSADWRAGAGAIWTFTTVTFFAVLSLPVAFYVLRSYWLQRRTLTPALRFAARLPLACLSALLLAFFVAFRFL